jgi:hypothetical protein
VVVVLTLTREEVAYHALADECRECEAHPDRLTVTDLMPDDRRECTVATVECGVCGARDRRDIPTGRRR